MKKPTFTRAEKEMPIPMYDMPPGLTMTEKGLSLGPYSAFRNQGWTDEQLIDHGYAMAGDPEFFARIRRAGIDNYRRQIEEWCAEARRMGFVITIEQVSDYPPAMGKHHDVVTVREVRK